jgi:hypothetical protein
MRSTLIPAALAAAIAAVASLPAAALTPASTAAATGPTSAPMPVQYYYGPRHHYRGGWVPPRLRGYEDPGYAYHGNVNGCAEDLGYGRWEPCDRGR